MSEQFDAVQSGVLVFDAVQGGCRGGGLLAGGVRNIAEHTAGTNGLGPGGLRRESFIFSIKPDSGTRSWYEVLFNDPKLTYLAQS